MKNIILGLSLVGVLTFAAVPGAEAKGCIKGAIVGGIAGHLLHHHAVLGAIAGCAIGHHVAAKHDHPAKPVHPGH